uniref:Uncharacterized protein n=1 Tax=Rhizophora mucronata TaxID=61149 RepID=A0A2P2QB84_RHIMU
MEFFFLSFPYGLYNQTKIEELAYFTQRTGIKYKEDKAKTSICYKCKRSN